MSFEHSIALAVRNPTTFARKCLARATAFAPGFPRRLWLHLGDVRFECDFALGPKVRDMCFGAYEPEEVEVFRSVLRRGDVVVDAGANIGYFTAVAASLVGAEGEVHAFEPVPGYFARLEALRAANPRHRILANPVALGASEGRAEIRVSGTGNLGWNTLVPELMSRESAVSVHEVRVRRLDAYLEEHGIERLALLKVDVEGFELALLRGFSGWLERHSARPVILCEVAPGAYPPQGARVGELFELLARFGYQASTATVDGQPLGPNDLRETTNVLFRAGPRLAV
ncbi:MAG TPA: FkbM family methyltransferase [Candidatus Sulfotelmatobacter sp.]|nr:FkbM family methyltransferase [Candidatus Sulfotelmatobacter sp.]